jgi:hypothetical protein
MSTITNFGDKQLIEPGGSSRVLGGSVPIPSPASFGNVLIVDTGIGAGYGGGAGVNGTLTNNKDAIYEMTDPYAAKSFFKGGILWDLIDYLFAPSANGGGIPKLIYIKGATTTPATKTLTFTNGAITLNAKNEGLIGNGTIVSSKIRKGHGVRLKAGVINTSKFILEISEGTFKGLDYESEPFDGISDVNCEPKIYASPEVSTLAELKAWMDNSQVFQSNFTYSGYSVTSGGTIVAGDITSLVLAVFTGGTETYGSSDVDKAISYADDIDHTFFLCDQYEANVGSANNNKILTNILNSRFTKFMFVGGARNATDFATYSIAAAVTYNSPKVVLTHSGIQVTNITKGFGLKNKQSIYSAAIVLGRISGLAPQVPGTWKDLRILSTTHNLTYNERIQALQAGVLHFKFVDSKGWVINQSINTLQNNTTQILPNGTSFEISIMRIVSQLNKELILEVEKFFVGGNVNNTSTANVEEFAKTFLKSKLATRQDDNLIMLYQNVNATISQDTLDLRYEFMPNGPINKIISTGFMLNVIQN